MTPLFPPKLSKHAQHDDIGGALGEVSNSLQDFGSYSQVRFAFLKCISGAAPFHCQGHHIMKNCAQHSTWGSHPQTVQLQTVSHVSQEHSTLIQLIITEEITRPKLQ